MSNNSPPKLNKKIVAELDNRPRQISTIIGPFLLDTNDPRPSEKSNRGDSIKYLTIKKRYSIIEFAKRLRRKDDKMANGSNNKTKYIQHASMAILAIAAINGVAQYLGGTLKDCFVAAVLVAFLYVKALDFTK